MIRVAALVLAATVAWGSSGRPIVGAGPGGTEERLRRIEREGAAASWYCTATAAESLAYRSAARLGSMWLHKGADDSLRVFAKDYDGTIHEYAFGSAVTTEADPVFVAWKPTYVVIGATDSSLARSGGVQKTLKVNQAVLAVHADSSLKRTGNGTYASPKQSAINPAYTNTFTVIENFSQGLTTEYRAITSASAPTDAELNTAFGSSLANGFIGVVTTTEAPEAWYICVRANSAWRIVALTDAL